MLAAGRAFADVSSVARPWPDKEEATARQALPSLQRPELTRPLDWVPLEALMKTVISTSEAPAAVGPYSQAIGSGPLLFCSGQIPLDARSGELLQADVSAQTKLVLDNVGSVLKAYGLGFPDVVKTTVFLTDLGQFAEMNAIYAKYFAEQPPARSTIQVAALPKGAKVEIEAIAIKPS